MKKDTLDLPQLIISALSAVSIAVIVFIFVFVFYRAMPVFSANGADYFFKGGFDVQINEAFYSSDAEPALTFGMLGLISGTVVTTFLALLIASLVGIGSAITICEFSSPRISAILIAVVRIFAAVPSVVFGLIGLITVVPFVEKLFVTTEMQIQYLTVFQMTGRNMLSAVIVLAVMIVPTIITLSVDALNSVPQALKETGYAFGMTKFRVIYKIMLPCARSGILAGIILGAGRGIGEAIAISMVCGGLGIIPDAKLGLINFLAPTLPLASAIVNKSEAMGSFAVESALFSCGATLLIIGTALSIFAKFVEKRLRKRDGHDD
ncbi:MAG: phosphate ABC transporter permease subunit PstC [Sedimentibacter sp.]